MPKRNIIKKYLEGAYYHIYNRGVAKGPIFNDKQDTQIFLKYLFEATDKYSLRILNYVLMPNHFHLLLKQKYERDIEKVMRSALTRYTMYYNKKYSRVGPLCQGNYLARLLENDFQVFIVFFYIENHNNEKCNSNYFTHL